MTVAVITTPWMAKVDAQGQSVQFAELFLDFPVFEYCRDVTEQTAAVVPPDPNLHARQVKTADTLLLDQIEANPKYFVLWRDDIPGQQTPDPATPAWFAQLRVYLLSQGFTALQINDAIGVFPDSRTVGRIASDLNTYMSTRT